MILHNEVTRLWTFPSFWSGGVTVSRTPDNPSRKFWGCHNFKESSRCRFFKWVDECGNKFIQQEDKLMCVMKIVAELLMFIAIMLVIVALKNVI
uniref:GRF-type domain-containing protein n=1 Tax=Lactuca sativa TaxID=4236 RepID=A0A9R1X3H7_LACSA|nr:hypothetical protein LSAT_V11C700343840 [Lactuca sativa]